MEENDLCPEASTITQGLYANLQICPLDTDYYSLDLQAGDVMTVTLRFSHDLGDSLGWDSHISQVNLSRDIQDAAIIPKPHNL